MSLADLLPALSELPRTDKFRVVQFLTAELAHQEGSLSPGADYPVWSPYDAHSAAAVLLHYLREQSGTP